MESTKEPSPDELMERFQGRSLKSIIVFTLLVHAVILLGTSVPFIIKKVTGSKGLSEEQRRELAIKEATTALQKIAKTHDMRPQELSDQLAGGAKPAAKPAEAPSGTGSSSEPEEGSTDEPGEPKSAIEEELEVAEPGPTVPPVLGDEEDDLFK